MLVPELLMKDADEAWAALSLALKKRDRGDHDDSLNDFLALMRSDPHSFPFFNLFQRTYVLYGLVELAKKFAPARAALDDLLRVKKSKLAGAPSDRHLMDDVASLQRCIDTL